MNEQLSTTILVLCANDNTINNTRLEFIDVLLDMDINPYDDHTEFIYLGKDITKDTHTTLREDIRNFDFIHYFGLNSLHVVIDENCPKVLITIFDDDVLRSIYNILVPEGVFITTFRERVDVYNGYGYDTYTDIESFIQLMISYGFQFSDSYPYNTTILVFQKPLDR